MLSCLLRQMQQGNAGCKVPSAFTEAACHARRMHVKVTEACRAHSIPYAQTEVKQQLADMPR